jgi:hypothetical protein
MNNITGQEEMRMKLSNNRIGRLKEYEKENKEYHYESTKPRQTFRNQPAMGYAQDRTNKIDEAMMK